MVKAGRRLGGARKATIHALSSKAPCTILLTDQMQMTAGCGSMPRRAPCWLSHRVRTGKAERA